MAENKKKRREEEIAKAQYAKSNVRVKDDAPEPRVVRNYGIKPLYQRIEERRDQSRAIGRQMRSERNNFIRDAMQGGIQMAQENQDARQNQRNRDMAIDMIRNGKLKMPGVQELSEVTAPGFGYKRAGNKAVYATHSSPLPDPKKAKTATRAEAPGAFGISPKEYLGGMRAIQEQEAFGMRGAPARATRDTMANEGARNFLDRWFPEKQGELPTQDEMIAKWAQVAPHEQDLYWMDYQNAAGAIDEHRATGEADAAAYEEEKKKRQADYDEAIRLLGEDAPKYANESDADRLGRFANTYGMGEAAQQYAQEYKTPGLFENYDAHDAEMYMIMHPEQKDKLGEYAGTKNETGYSILHREMTPDQKNVYMALAAVHGEAAAQEWLESMLADEGYNERAYWTRDRALREYADEHPVLATGDTFWKVPGQLAGGAYVIGQRLKGEEIDPYNNAFMPAQAVQTPRDEVSKKIDRENSPLIGWLMNAGYNALTSAGDSAIAGILSMGMPGGGALMQGLWGFGGTAQDATMRGAEGGRAALLAGVNSVIEAVTEYLPMEHLIRTLDAKDIRGFGQILLNGLKDGALEAPGEGLSELGSYIGDDLIMGEMSKWDALVAEKGKAGAALQVAGDVLNSAFVGFLSGAGSSTLAGTGAAVRNNLRGETETQTQQQAQSAKPGEKPAVKFDTQEENQEGEGSTLLVKKDEKTAQQPAQEEADYWEPEAEEGVEMAKDAIETHAAPAQETEQPAQESKAEERQAEEEKPAKTAENAKEGNALRVEREVRVRRGKTEQQMTVTGVAAVTDGTVFLNVRNEDGENEVVSAGDAEFDDPATNELLASKQTRNMDARTASIFLEGYEAKLARPQEYAEAFASAYEDGRAGLEYERMLQVDRKASAFLTSETRLKAYAAGMNTRPDAEAARTGGVVRRYSKEAWKLLEGQRKNRARANLELADALGKRMGRKITVLDRVTDEAGNEVNGRYNPKTGEIEVALNADAEAYAYVAMHELTHAIKAEHKDAWHDFENFVADALERNGQDIADLVQEQMERHGLDGEAAMEEVICNTVPALLKDEQNLLSLYKGNRTLFERVMDWVRSFLDDIKASGDILAKGSRDWKQMDALKQNREDMQTLLAKMEEIFDSEGKEKDHSSTEGGMAGDATVIKLSKKESEYDPETAAIKQQIANSSELLNSMEVVARESVPEKMHNKRAAGEWAIGVLKSTGYQVDRQGFGVIKFDEEDIRKAMNYANTEAEKAAIAALPKVLKRGIEIGRHNDHKKRAKQTVTFAAPVELNGVRGNMAVVVNMNRNHYYTHRIVLPDGSVFKFGEIKKETVQEPQRGVTVSSSLANATSTASKSSIASENKNVNGKFSRKGLEEGVEETRDLIAVHNMTEENLRAALELGGLAMPSIAVIKAQQGHTKYGPISAVFDKYTIDPETFRNNEVYGGDAWTPTFPQVRYEASEKAWDRIRKKYYELEKKVGNQTARIMYPYMSALDEELNSKGGVQGIVKKLEDNTDMMQMYLADNGWEKTEPEKKVVVKRTAKHLAEQYDSLIEKMGEDVIRSFEAPEGSKIGDHRRAWMAEHGEKLKQAYIEVLADAVGLPEANVAALAEDKANVRKMLMDAYYYLKNGGEIREEVTDYEGFNKMIRAKVDRPAYRAWLEELFKGAEKRKGIRNDKDIFTPSGNRRSFAQTHWELTLENAVKAMRAEEKTGVGSIGGRNIEGAAVKKYGSIAEIKADKDRLRMVPEEEYELMRQSFREHFNDLAREYAMDKDEVNGDWIDAGNALVDYITKAETADGIYKLMQKDAKFYRPSRSLAEDLAELVEEMKNAPTGYFEAKPRRAVGFDEVAALLVPDNLPDDLRNQLKENGIDLIDYEAGNEDDRLEKINSERVSGLRFSRKGLDANIDAELEHTRDALELVRHGHRITAMEADQLARKLIKETNSEYDVKEAAMEIAGIFDYIERAERVDMDHVDDMQTRLVAKMLEKSRVLDMDHEDLVQPIRDYFKKVPISLSDTQKEEASLITGSYLAYRRKLMGRVRLTKNGLSLEKAWQELHDMLPDWFPEDTNVGDMPEMLLQVVDAMKPAYDTPMNIEETASWMAGKLNEAYLTLPAVKAAAKSSTQLGRSVTAMRKAMTAFAEASGEEFEAALKQLERARKKNKDTSDQEAWNELRRQWDEWKAKDADEREERFQMDLQRAKDKLKTDDLAMRTVYAKVMAEAYKRQRAKDMAEMREREALKKQRGRVEATVRTLTTWMDRPTDSKHIPIGLEEPLKDLLTSLDFSGKNTKAATQLADRLNALATAVEDAQEKEDDARTIFLERDQQMVDELRRVAQLIKGNTEGRGVYDLNSMELKELNKWMGVVKHTITEANKMHGTNLGDVQQVAQETIDELKKKKPMKDKKWITKQWEKYFGTDMMDSFTFFERMGRTSGLVFKGLRDGFDKSVQLIREAEEYTKKILKDVDLKKLSGKKAEKLTFEIGGDGGRKLEMTRAQMMELYVLNKREQARGHIYGDGIRLKGSEDAHSYALDENDVAMIIDKLTEKEKQIADEMQKFMAERCAEWGNEASMVLLGYEKFGEEHYWPIATDSNARNTLRLEDNFAANISAIKNQGMTKALTEGARNTIMIGDIFDTYTQHISNMSAYSAYAVPLSDVQRWFNSKGVKTEIEHVMGAKGKTYIQNFLMAINGTAASTPMTDVEKLAKAAARNAKAAAVGGNLRVIVQQPTSYARAAMLMSPKYLTAALSKKAAPAELVNKYCSIAAWKRYGFLETNVGPGLRQMIVGDATKVDKARDLLMKPAAACDNWTLNRLWAACELETADIYPELEKGSEEYYQKVGERTSEIIDRTQVVDSPFHRSQIMRSKNWMAQTLTNFMSEPTKTFNMLTGAIYDYAENRKNPAARARVARALNVWAVSSVLTAAAAGLVDAIRDDDEEKTWLEKYRDAVLGNTADAMNPLGMLPGVKDALSIIEGYDPSRIDQQSIQKIVWAWQEIEKYMNGTSKLNLHGVTYKVAQALSSVTGIAAANLWRDLEAVVETVMGKNFGLNEKARKNQTINSLYNTMAEADAAKTTKEKDAAKKKIDEARAKLTKIGMNPKEIDTALAERLAEDPRIKAAWEAKQAHKVGDVNRTKNALAHEGFTGEMVDKAIAEYGKTVTPKEEKEKDMDAQLKAKLFTQDEAVAAIRAGVSNEDIEYMMSELVSDSSAKDPEKSVRDGLKTEVKKDYLEAVKKGDRSKADRNRDILTSVLKVPEADLTKWEQEQHADDLRFAIDAYNSVNAAKAVAVMRADGKSDSDIKGALDKYRQMYIDAVKNKDSRTANKIKSLLLGLGLTGKNGKPLYTEETFSKWLMAK